MRINHDMVAKWVIFTLFLLTLAMLYQAGRAQGQREMLLGRQRRVWGAK